MGLDYLDLMLIHWPMGNDGEIWSAFEDLVKEGCLRSIGVSNFYPVTFDRLVRNASIVPAVNQIETHVFYQRCVINRPLPKSCLPFCENER